MCVHFRNNVLYLHRVTSDKANDNTNTFSFSRQVIKILAKFQKKVLSKCKKRPLSV